MPSSSKTGIGLDRLDDSKGYEVGNVVSCCTECNLARGCRFTPKEMKIIGAAIRRVKLARLKPLKPVPRTSRARITEITAAVDESLGNWMKF
jgi:hypothetical protein